MLGCQAVALPSTEQIASQQHVDELFREVISLEINSKFNFLTMFSFCLAVLKFSKVIISSRHDVQTENYLLIN